MRRLLLFIIPLILLASSAGAQLPEPQSYTPFTRIHGDAEVGWYAVSDVYKFIADVNVNFDFGSWKEVRFNFNGGILTLIKDIEVDNFQPDRYRGTLEPSAYWRQGYNIYSFAVRHQSFHAIDREPVFDESYELYLLGYERQANTNLTFTVGKYANRSDVDYDWDFYLDVTNACIGVCRYGPIYYDITGHYVTEDGDIDRGSFFDYNLEVGFQTKRGIRYFTAYRQIHDVDQFDGTTDHQLVLGAKFIW